MMINSLPTPGDMDKKMKAIIVTVLCLCMSQTAFPQEPSTTKTPTILAPDKFDEWGDVPFPDELAHLDKIAHQLKEWRMSIVYLVIHAGQRACKGEAKARGIRARDHLLKAQVEPERIVWIDAGWKKDLTVEVWILPPELGRPTPSTNNKLKPSEVRIERNCKIKYRGGISMVNRTRAEQALAASGLAMSRFFIDVALASH
jgi:hypothetical protein